MGFSEYVKSYSDDELRALVEAEIARRETAKPVNKARMALTDAIVEYMEILEIFPEDLDAGAVKKDIYDALKAGEQDMCKRIKKAKSDTDILMDYLKKIR